MVVVVKLNDEYRLFGIIESIVVTESSEALFIIRKLLPVCFNAGFHAYNVETEPDGT